MIDEAKRPLIIAGHGVVLAGAEDALLAAGRKGPNIPVVTTLLGIGAMPETHPLCLGMAGMHGEAYTNLALTEADLIVALGSRFDDRLTGPVEPVCPQGARSSTSTSIRSRSARTCRSTWPSWAI